MFKPNYAANILYRSLRSRVRRGQVWLTLTRCSRHLLSLVGVMVNDRVMSRHDAGPQMVLVKQIQRSESGKENFDGNFNSLWGGERQIQPKHLNNEVRQVPATAERWRVIGRVIGQQVRGSLSSWRFYGVAVVTLGLVIGLHCCCLWFTGESGLYILSRPFVLSLQVVTLVGYLYVMFGAALSQMPSRRQGLQRSNWTAAGDISTLVTARFLAFVCIYTLLLLILIPLLVLVTLGGNLVVPPSLLWSLVPSLLSAGLAVSGGLFIAVAIHSREAAVAVVASVVLIVLVLQGSHLVLASLPPANPYQAVAPLLQKGQQFLPYLSPFAASDAILDAALRSDIPALLRLVLVTLLNITVWLAATCLMLKRRDKLP